MNVITIRNVVYHTSLINCLEQTFGLGNVISNWCVTSAQQRHVSLQSRNSTRLLQYYSFYECYLCLLNKGLRKLAKTIAAVISCDKDQFFSNKR